MNIIRCAIASLAANGSASGFTATKTFPTQAQVDRTVDSIGSSTTTLYGVGSSATALSSEKGRYMPKTVNKDIKIVIAGGGIGGMTLALSLVDAGFWNVDIYESTTLAELGVGINIQPSAIRELTELGLGDELEKIGIPTKEILYFHKNGQFIYGEPRGLGAGYNCENFIL